MPTNPAPAIRRALLLSMLLLAGCGTVSRPYSPKLPALPKEARQPPVPAICVPSCSERLKSDFEAWQRKLTPAEPPALPASGPLML